MADETTTAVRYYQPDWEVNGRTRIGALICSDAFGGKSTFAASFPWPICVASFDAFGKELPYCELGRPTKWYMGENGLYRRLVYHPERDEVIVQIESYVDPEPEKPIAWAKFRERMRMMPSEVGRWGTWVCDSMTDAEFTARLESMYVINTVSKAGNEAHGKKHYGHSMEQIQANLLRRLASMPMNVVVASRYNDEAEEVNGVRRRQPALPGQLSKNAPGGFTEFYRLGYNVVGTGTQAKVEQRWLQTVPDHEYNAGSMLRVPNGTAPNYEAIWKALGK